MHPCIACCLFHLAKYPACELPYAVMSKQKVRKTTRGRIGEADREAAASPAPKAASATELASRVGEKLKRGREALGWTLEKVVEAVDAHPFKQKISAAHISRIENGLAVPSIIELQVLNDVLQQPFSELFAFKDVQPWFIVREAKAKERLEEIVKNPKLIERADAAHRVLIEEGIYRWAPLVQSEAIVDSRDREGTMAPQMSKLLFRVGLADTDLMERPDALEGHEGEEIIYVLDGEIEFWCKHEPSADATRHRLRRGDCLHFSSKLLHGFRALGAKPADALFIYTLPPSSAALPLVKEKTELTKGGNK